MCTKAVTRGEILMQAEHNIVVHFMLETIRKKNRKENRNEKRKKM